MLCLLSIIENLCSPLYLVTPMCSDGRLPNVMVRLLYNCGNNLL